jgi:phenylacetic acid degradation operon negative regulatory protein
MDAQRDPYPAVAALLRRFRAQRPLRGGSLLMTVFGDAIAPRGERIALGSLIGLARPFGLAERLVRTSVARLAADGWLAALRRGRRSEYRLSDTGHGVFAEATRRIYAVSRVEWDGIWTLLTVPPGGEARAELRERLHWYGFGQLAPGVFVHPSGSARQAASALPTDGTEGAWRFTSRAESLEADRRLAAAAWDLADLARRYRRFRDAFAPVEACGCLHRLAPESAFVVRTLLIHEYRKIHLRDPLLPPALLPEDWVGAEAYALCRRLYAAVFGAAEHHLDAYGATLDGPLPSPGAEVFARFGGLSPP